jgi:hypothetical protein
MTFQPVLPPILLGLLAVAVLTARVVALRRTKVIGRARWRWAAMTLATLLVFAAAARPVLEPADPGASLVADRDAPNVFVVLDRSPDMQVRDGTGTSRTSIAREDVLALIDRYPGARIALISFSARPTLEWPLSADTWSLRPLADGLQPLAAGPDSVAQANAGAAGNMLRYQLINAVQQYPRARTLVYYLGSGTPGSEQPPRDFNLPDGAVDGGAVIGYGAAGEPALRGVADQIGVPYVARTGAGPLPGVPTDAPVATPATGTPSASSGRTELYWAPALLAAVLILTELSLVLREFRRTRMVTQVLP